MVFGTMEQGRMVRVVGEPGTGERVNGVWVSSTGRRMRVVAVPGTGEDGERYWGSCNSGRV